MHKREDMCMLGLFSHYGVISFENFLNGKRKFIIMGQSCHHDTDFKNL